LVKEIGFAQAFSFKYSPRPGTPAAGMRKQIGDAIKSERLARLQALLAEQTRAFNDRSVGRVLPVLLERPGRRPGEQVGRTPYLQMVHVEATGSVPGETVDALITKSHTHSLAAASVASAVARSDLHCRGMPPCA
jgi:tRNA-2-methylthio-N6-dimethylallyladenosine synthase